MLESYGTLWIPVDPHGNFWEVYGKLRILMERDRPPSKCVQACTSLDALMVLLTTFFGSQVTISILSEP